VSPNAWLGWALLSAVFAALTAVLAKAGLTGLHPDLATFLRTVVILALLALMVTVGGNWQDPRALPARSVLLLVLSGLATGASWACYFRALQAGDAARVAPVDKLSVVLVALFAAAFLGERPTAWEWAGIALVGAGVVLVALGR
jgi:transporter family protein